MHKNYAHYLKKEKRYIWLDILKIMACFCVIVNHTGGYLLLSNNKYNEFNFKEIFKKIIRISVPFVGISLLFYIRDNGIHNFSLIFFLKKILCEPYLLPFWYLYTLIGLYLVVPFIKKMIDKFSIKDYKIFILLFLILPSLLPILSNYLNINLSGYFFTAFFPMVIAYFISGIYLSKISISKKNFAIAILSFISSSVLYFLSFYHPYLITGTISYSYDTYTSFFCVIQSLSIFYIVRYLFENFHFSKIISIIIEEISKSTFGIYLFHSLIIYKIYNLGIMQNIFGINPYLGIISLELSVFSICGIITFILRRIPIIKRFL